MLVPQPTVKPRQFHNSVPENGLARSGESGPEALGRDHK